MMTLERLLCACLLVHVTSGYYHFRLQVPNGEKVPSPCQAGTWGGVGHLRSSGGGPRNQFGMDFAANNFTWNAAICNKDSDGDGRSNGDELGDPYCMWTPGATPSYSTNLSHPGVCNPWGSPECMAYNSGIHCGTDEFICDAINEPGVFNVTLRMPRTKVPPSSYTYMCYTFLMDELEPGVDYHIIAIKPHIDNPFVLHHFQLNGCGPTAEPLSEPEVCNMAGASCQQYLAYWNLGMAGDCVYEEAGIHISREKYKWLTLQLHWTNPEHRTDHYDSSGVVLYMTKNLRPHNAGIWLTGQLAINIPPGSDRHTVRSTCTPDCTQKIIKGDVHLLSGLNHMHYLGIGGNVEHYRQDEKIRNLIPDDIYSYNNPLVHIYDPPHTIKPGDHLESTCVFRSTSRTTTTMFGESAEDEMCLNVFTFYPAENITHDSCYAWNDYQTCFTEYGAINGCAFYMIFNASDPERVGLLNTVLDSCNFYGECRQECPAAIARVREHPCFNDYTGPYMMDLLRALNPDPHMVKFLAAMQSCECPTDSHWTMPPPIGYPETSSGSRSLMSLWTCIALAVVKIAM